MTQPSTEFDMTSRIKPGLLNPWSTDDPLLVSGTDQTNVWLGQREMGGLKVGYLPQRDRKQFVSAGADLIKGYNFLMNPMQPDLPGDTLPLLQTTSLAGLFYTMSKRAMPDNIPMKIHGGEGDVTGICPDAWNEIWTFISNFPVLNIGQYHHSQQLCSPAGHTNAIDHKVLLRIIARAYEILLEGDKDQIKWIKYKGKWYATVDPNHAKFITTMYHFTAGDSDHFGTWGILPAILKEDLPHFYALNKSNPETWKLFLTSKVVLIAVYFELQKGEEAEREFCHLTINEFVATVTTGKNALGDTSTLYLYGVVDESKWKGQKSRLFYHSDKARIHMAPLMTKKGGYFTGDHLIGSPSTWVVKASHHIAMRLTDDGLRNRAYFRSQDVALFEDIGHRKGPRVCGNCDFIHIKSKDGICRHLFSRSADVLSEIQFHLMSINFSELRYALSEKGFTEFREAEIQETGSEIVEISEFMADHASFFGYYPAATMEDETPTPRMLNLCEDVAFDFYPETERAISPLSPSRSVFSKSLFAISSPPKSPIAPTTGKSLSPSPNVMQLDTDHSGTSSSYLILSPLPSTASTPTSSSQLTVSPRSGSATATQSTCGPSSPQLSMPPNKKRRIDGISGNVSPLQSQNRNRVRPRRTQQNGNLSSNTATRTRFVIDPNTITQRGYQRRNIFEVLRDFDTSTSTSSDQMDQDRKNDE